MAASNSSRKSNASVVSSVRAILNYRKGFATAKEIRKDYEGLEGELPFSDKSLEDLLKGSRNDFTFQNAGGELKFNAKVEADSSHKQNSHNGAKKKNVSLPRSVKPDHETVTSWRSNSTAYSQMYSDLPRSKPNYNNYNGNNKPKNGNKFNNNNNNNNNNNGQMRNKNSSGPLSPSHNGNNTNGSKRNDWRHAPEKTDPKPHETDLRNKLNPPNDRSALNAITNQNGQQTALPVKKSMNDRLVVKAPVELPKLQITSLADRLNKARTFNDQEFVQSPSQTPNAGWDLGSANDTTKLEMYCKTNGYDAPEYKFFAVKDKLQVTPRIDCRLTVNDKIYSCYPSSFASEQEAKLGVSKIAVESIQSQEQFLKYPLDKDTDYEIAYKIFEMIKQFPSGCFKKCIKELYNSSYKLSLPQDWYEMIYDQIGKIFEVTSEENESQCIILAITSSTPIEPPSSPNSFSDKPMIPLLKYPFGDTHWNLFVMNPLSTNQVFARLIGTSFSDQLDVLLTEIEMKFHATTPARPININTSTIYLCSIADCWHRIRVIHTEHDQAYCFCIDNGEFEWISIQEIFVCDNEFLKLAAQAFEISMFGLEDFEQNPDSRQILDQNISYKSLIGEIITTKTEHEKNPEGSLKVILFDTSGEDDVNLNETIVHKILSSTPLPVLSLHQQNHVVVTHVGDYIYCQIKQSFSYIEQLIHNLMKSKFDKKEHQGLYKDNSDTKKLYLVFDPKRKKWYRARLVAGRADTCKMNYVDFGLTDDVDKVNIYRLDKISIALSLYPAQSIKVCLAGVKMTEDVRKQLRALLPGNKEAFAKVASNVNGLPQVLLYVHIIHNNAQLLIKVNDTFHLEKDIQPKESTVEASKTSNGDLTDKSNNLSPKASTKLTSYKLTPNGEFIKIRMTQVSSPQNFIIQMFDDLKKLESMMDELQGVCKAQKNGVSIDLIIKGEAYAACNDIDGKWYRATVENVCDPTLIHVYLVDFGDFKILSTDKLRLLPQKFRELPKQALKGKLHGVKAKHGDYTPEDAFWFQNLTEHKIFPGVIKQISNDHFTAEAVLEVVLFTENQKVNDILIEENRALSI